MENIFPRVLPQLPPLTGTCPGAPDTPIALDVFSTTSPSAILPPVPHRGSLEVPEIRIPV